VRNDGHQNEPQEKPNDPTPFHGLRRIDVLPEHAARAKDLLSAAILNQWAIDGLKDLKRGLRDSLGRLTGLHSRNEIIPQNS
jgi:hypothetical protein